MRRGLALFSLVCLVLAVPPAGFGFASLLGFLVFPGWMAFYAMEQGARRPWWQAWLVGTLHMFALSVSLFASFSGAVVAIALAGGFYYLLTTAWTRALRRFVPGPIAFGAALAACSWLRANMWDIECPHAQPAHSLYLWPELLGCVRWGSESLANFFVGALAAACVDVYRAWRVGTPRWGKSLIVLAATFAVAAGMSYWPWPTKDTGKTADVVLVEPRLRGTWRVDFPGQIEAYEFLRGLILEPTLAVAGPAAKKPPQLVVWPESISLHGLRVEEGTDVEGRNLVWFEGQAIPLGKDCRLLAGGLNEVWSLERVGSDTERSWVIRKHWATAVLTGATGEYHGHYEKAHLVLGGENQPWLCRAWLIPFMEWVMGKLPQVDRGRPEFRVPLELEDGTRFGPLICYDNAFPDVCLAHREAGAQFLMVISNESWYFGGNELDQMLAMSVFRCLETGLPMIRSTVDGYTGWLDADGQIREHLGYHPELRRQPALLRVNVPLREGGKHPLHGCIGVYPGFGSSQGAFCYPPFSDPGVDSCGASSREAPVSRPRHGPIRVLDDAGQAVRIRRAGGVPHFLPSCMSRRTPGAL